MATWSELATVVGSLTVVFFLEYDCLLAGIDKVIANLNIRKNDRLRSAKNADYTS